MPCPFGLCRASDVNLNRILRFKSIVMLLTIQIESEVTMNCIDLNMTERRDGIGSETLRDSPRRSLISDIKLFRGREG